jgi:hypothetical protein
MRRRGRLIPPSPHRQGTFYPPRAARCGASEAVEQPTSKPALGGERKARRYPLSIAGAQAWQPLRVMSVTIEGISFTCHSAIEPRFLGARSIPIKPSTVFHKPFRTATPEKIKIPWVPAPKANQNIKKRAIPAKNHRIPTTHFR